jgi:HD-GYP domain-containing protein (c-di-GMP phosphodiesterase class II)
VDAFAELERGAGTQFDPRIVAAFLSVWQTEALPLAV